METHSNQVMTSPDPMAASRYGGVQRTRLSKKGGRLIAIIALLAAIGVTFWFAFSASSTMLSYKTVGYKIQDPTAAWVEFELTKEPAETVACTIRVLTDTAAVAGYRTVVIEAEPDSQALGKDRTKYYDTTLRTDQLGSSGEVDTCWYVDEAEAPNITNFRDY